MNHAISITESLEQMDKGQDQTYSGVFRDEETDEEGQWGLITDGHGTNKCIDFLRSIPQTTLNEIVGSKTPVENLAAHINRNASIPIHESSGATMCLAKVYKDRVMVINCGDSQACVYKNGEQVFLSEEHTCSNEKERQRLEKMGIKYQPSGNIEVVAETKLCGVSSQYAVFPPNFTLASTQSLGHNGRTGYDPDVTMIPYEPGDTIQVVIGSDGFWDMIIKGNNSEMNSFASKTSDELLKFSVGRWLQEWEMYRDKTTKIFHKCAYTRNQCDDVSVVKIDIIPITTNNIQSIFSTDCI